MGIVLLVDQLSREFFVQGQGLPCALEQGVLVQQELLAHIVGDPAKGDLPEPRHGRGSRQGVHPLDVLLLAGSGLVPAGGQVLGPRLPEKHPHGKPVEHGQDILGPLIPPGLHHGIQQLFRLHELGLFHVPVQGKEESGGHGVFRIGEQGVGGQAVLTAAEAGQIAHVRPAPGHDLRAHPGQRGLIASVLCRQHLQLDLRPTGHSTEIVQDPGKGFLALIGLGPAPVPLGHPVHVGDNLKGALPGLRRLELLLGFSGQPGRFLFPAAPQKPAIQAH